MIAIIIEGFLQTRDSDGGGLRTIADRVRTELGAIVAYLQWDDDVVSAVRSLHEGHPDEPIVVLGYSYGGGKAVRAAWELSKLGIYIDEFIDLDGVPRWLSGQFQNLGQILCPFIPQDSARIDLPRNIHRAQLFYQRNNSPWGVLLTECPDGSVINTDITNLGAGHVELPGTPAVQDLIFARFAALAGQPPLATTGSK